MSTPSLYKPDCVKCNIALYYKKHMSTGISWSSSVFSSSLFSHQNTGAHKMFQARHVLWFSGEEFCVGQSTRSLEVAVVFFLKCRTLSPKWYHTFRLGLYGLSELCKVFYCCSDFLLQFKNMQKNKSKLKKVKQIWVRFDWLLVSIRGSVMVHFNVFIFNVHWR